MIPLILRLCAVAFTLFPIAASAHVAFGDSHGFMHGFSHPLSGIDHILAMVAVGLFAAHLGGRALWLVPLTFVSVMALAGIAGMAGVQLPFVEIGIGLSVILFGLGVAPSLCGPPLLPFGLLCFFSILHSPPPPI